MRQHRCVRDQSAKFGSILRTARAARGISQRAWCSDGSRRRPALSFRDQARGSAPVGRQLGLFENPPGIDHISFAVADVDGVYAKLSAAGVKFDGAPQDQSWGARMVGLKDPDANNLYLLQKP